jgi:serine protease Do
MTLVSAPGVAGAALPFTTDGKSVFAAIYEKVAPAVVLIEVTKEQPRRSSMARGRNNGSETIEGTGSGVIIDRDGHVLTNNHVIENATKITVRLERDIEYQAEIVGRDPDTDLAIIKLALDGDRLSPERVAVLGDSDSLRPGDYAIAIGNPFGLERSITVGVISGLGRNNLQVMGAEDLRYQDFIQTDAQINPGNSGGALVNIAGEVIGINNMYEKISTMGFAIPVNMAKQVASQIVNGGKVKRGFIGIGGENITREIQQAMNLPGLQGILVKDITEGYPAEKAGVKKNDVILSINGQQIRDQNDFRLKIGERSPGDIVALELISGGIRKTVSLMLSDMEEFEESMKTPSWRGINVADISPALTSRYGLGAIDSGVVIVRIEEGSPASDANLRVGEVIVEIESVKIKSTDDFERVRSQYETISKNILIGSMMKQSNGKFEHHYVAVKSK